MKLAIVNEADGQLDYEGTLLSYAGVVIDLRLSIPEGADPYLTIDIGSVAQRGDPIEYPISRHQAAALVAQFGTPDETGMTAAQNDAFRELKSAGYAVILWTPDELGEVSASAVEDRSIELGWDIISDLGGPRAL